MKDKLSKEEIEKLKKLNADKIKSVKDKKDVLK